MRWTIQRTLFALGMVGCATAMLVGAVAYYSATRADGGRQRLVEQATAVRQAMQADMMHDALRADVLHAIFTARTAPHERKSVLDDTAEHISVFKAALGHESLLHAGPEVQAALRNLQAALDAYFSETVRITELAFEDREAAEKAYPSFQQAFERLEIGMGHLGDTTEHQSVVVEAAANAGSGQARVEIIGVVVFGILVSILIGAWVARKITADVLELLRASRASGEGDLTARAKVTSQNELGEAADA